MSFKSELIDENNKKPSVQTRIPVSKTTSKFISQLREKFTSNTQNKSKKLNDSPQTPSNNNSSSSLKDYYNPHSNATNKLDSQEKINPDIFKKIFNRNYTRISHPKSEDSILNERKNQSLGEKSQNENNNYNNNNNNNSPLSSSLLNKFTKSPSKEFLKLKDIFDSKSKVANKQQTLKTAPYKEEATITTISTASSSLITIPPNIETDKLTPHPSPKSILNSVMPINAILLNGRKCSSDSLGGSEVSTENSSNLSLASLSNYSSDCNADNQIARIASSNSKISLINKSSENLLESSGYASKELDNKFKNELDLMFSSSSSRNFDNDGTAHQHESYLNTQTETRKMIRLRKPPLHCDGADDDEDDDYNVQIIKKFNKDQEKQLNRPIYKVISRETLESKLAESINIQKYPARNEFENKKELMSTYEVMKLNRMSDNDSPTSNSSLSSKLDTDSSSDSDDFTLEKSSLTNRLLNLINIKRSKNMMNIPDTLNTKARLPTDEAVTLSTSTSISTTSSSSLSKISFDEQIASKLFNEIKKNMNSMEYEKLLQILKESIENSCQYYDVATMVNDGSLLSWRYINSNVEKYKSMFYKTKSAVKTDASVQIGNLNDQDDENGFNSDSEPDFNDINVSDGEYDNMQHEEDVDVDVVDDDDDHQQDEETKQLHRNIAQNSNKFVTWSGQNNIYNYRRNMRDFYDKMDRISESIHEESSSSTTSKDEQNKVCSQSQNNGKIYDETLKDAENISDIDEDEIDEWSDGDDEVLVERNRKYVGFDDDDVDLKKEEEEEKERIINEIITLTGDRDKNGAISFRGDDIARRLSDNLRRRSSNSSSKSLDRTDNNGDGKPKVKSSEKPSSKNSIYRCDAMVMFDVLNNVNFCKLCKFYEFSPPNKIINGVDRNIQVDSAERLSSVEVRSIECDNEKQDETCGNRESLKFRDFDYGPESDISEIKMDFQYEVKDSSSTIAIADTVVSSNVKYDEEAVKQRTRDGLKFWKDEDKKYQEKLASNKKTEKMNNKNNVSADVKTMISAFESKQGSTGDGIKSSSATKTVLRKFNQNRSIESQKSVDENNEIINKTSENGSEPNSRKNSKDLLKSEILKEISNMTGEHTKNVNVYSKTDNKHVNILFTDINHQDESSIKNDSSECQNETSMEEVEVVINVGNLPKFPRIALVRPKENVDNEAKMINEMNDRLRNIVISILPACGGAYIDEIVDDLKFIMKDDVYDIKSKDDFPVEIIDFINERYQTLLNGKFYSQDISISSTSDINSSYNNDVFPTAANELTELTVVKNLREHIDSDRTKNTSTDDDIIKLDEETLYIVEKIRKSTNSDLTESNSLQKEVDKEVRKNFKLMSKDSFDNEDEIGLSSTTATIGYSINDKFSAEALYDLNKQVVYRNELIKLNEQYTHFKTTLTAMLDDYKKLNGNLNYDNSDYQLHFIYLKNYNPSSSTSSISKVTPSNSNLITSVLMMSYNKNNVNYFNGDKELVHTQENIRLLRKNNEERKVSQNQVIARLNVIYVNNDDNDYTHNSNNFSNFSLLNLNGEESSTNFDRRYFVHIRYFKCPKQDLNADNMKLYKNAVEIRETMIDINLLPEQIRSELFIECKQYLPIVSTRKTFTSELNIRYVNDHLIMPSLSVLVIESDLIQLNINEKRDELINSTLNKCTNAKSLSEPKVVEVDNFVSTLEKELNSYLICEKVLDRDTEQTDTKDLVKLNKLDALISFETVQSFKYIFELLKPYNVLNSATTSNDVNTLKLNRSTNEFYIIDNEKYYKCTIPVEYINDKLRDELNEFKNLSEPAHYSSSLIIENMHKRQNYIFSKRLKAAFPSGSNDDVANKAALIRSIRLKKPTIRNKIAYVSKDRPLIRKLDDSDPINNSSSISDSELSSYTNSKSLTIRSASKPEQKYRVFIDYDKKQVTKKEIESPQQTPTVIKSQLCESGVQVDYEEKSFERKLIEQLISENSILKEQVNKSKSNDFLSKKDAYVETENDFDVKKDKDLKYTYDMVLDRSSYINEKKAKLQPIALMESFDNEECAALEYETMRNDMYIKFDEQDIKIMERKLIRDDIIIGEIDKMFHTIRDHQGAVEKVKADNGKRRRSNSWSYSSNKRHVRAKVMELKFFDKQKTSKKSISRQLSSSSLDDTLATGYGDSVFLRIDDFINPDISKTLIRSYSADYLNERTTLRTRIKYVRIPGEIVKTESITHYQYNIVPSEYRTVPYGLRYWSILKLLQDERESGQPYVYLGDTYIGKPPEEWFKTSPIIKEIICSGGVIDPNTIIDSGGEICNKDFHLDNQEIAKFMSTNNLEQEIEMIKTNEQKIRQYNDELGIDTKSSANTSKINIISPKLVISEKTVKYERKPDKILPTIEKVDSTKTSRLIDATDHKQPIYNRFLNSNQANNQVHNKKYQLLDDFLQMAYKSKIDSDNNKNDTFNGASLMNKLNKLENTPTNAYGQYYADTTQSYATGRDSQFVDLETIVSQRIDETQNYLRALSEDSVLNDKKPQKAYSYYPEYQTKHQSPQPPLISPSRIYDTKSSTPSVPRSSIPSRNHTAFDRSLSIPTPGTYHYIPVNPQYVYYDATDTYPHINAPIQPIDLNQYQDLNAYYQQIPQQIHNQSQQYTQPIHSTYQPNNTSFTTNNLYPGLLDLNQFYNNQNLIEETLSENGIPKKPYDTSSFYEFNCANRHKQGTS